MNLRLQGAVWVCNLEGIAKVYYRELDPTFFTTDLDVLGLYTRMHEAHRVKLLKLANEISTHLLDNFQLNFLVISWVSEALDQTEL